MRFTITMAVALLCLAASVAPAEAQLAAKRASQLVTLRGSGAACPVEGVGDAVDELQAADGTTQPFTTVPDGKALVVTAIEMFVGSGLTQGTSVNFLLARVTSPTSANLVVSKAARADAIGPSSGLASATVQIPSGAAVGPGVTLCVCASTASGCHDSANFTIYGFLAPDR